MRLGAVGASSLRVHLVGRGEHESPAEGLSLVAVDEGGGLVMSVGSLVAREVPAGQLQGAGGGGAGCSVWG